MQLANSPFLDWEEQAYLFDYEYKTHLANIKGRQRPQD